MNTAASTAEAPWASRIFSQGWITALGGDASVMEPATGATLGRISSASPEDVDNAARIALAARTAWAQTPFDRRAAVMHDAARLLQERSAEINEWNVRECGSIGPKADWELNSGAGCPLAPSV